jgi:hypothetical protein
MARETSVVTPQRFSEGLSYAEFIAQAKVNKQRFETFYQDFKVSAADTEALRRLTQQANGPTRLLVLGEDWCGDVVRGLPVLARMAEAAGWELRVFPRDQHQDIMNEFLKNGQWMSIPTAVFYTSDHRYITHWIERPKVAERETADIEAAIRAENPGINDQDFGRERRARTGARAADWQQGTVEELIRVLNEEVSKT